MPDVVKNAVVGLFMAGAVYGGIRQDIESMHRDIDRLERMTEGQAARLERHLDRIADKDRG